MSLLLRCLCLHLNPEFTANEWRTFSRPALWPSGEIINGGLMREMRKTLVFRSHPHYHPNDPCVGFVDDSAMTPCSPIVAGPLPANVGFYSFTLGVFVWMPGRRHDGTRKPRVVGYGGPRRVNWLLFQELLLWTIPPLRRKPVRRRENVRVCVARGDICVPYVTASSLFFISPTDLPLVVTSACRCVCPGTAALLSLRASGVPSASLNKITPGPLAARVGELKVTRSRFFCLSRSNLFIIRNFLAARGGLGRRVVTEN